MKNRDKYGRRRVLIWTVLKSEFSMFDMTMVSYQNIKIISNFLKNSKCTIGTPNKKKHVLRMIVYVWSSITRKWFKKCYYLWKKKRKLKMKRGMVFETHNLSCDAYTSYTPKSRVFCKSHSCVSQKSWLFKLLKFCSLFDSSLSCSYLHLVIISFIFDIYDFKLTINVPSYFNLFSLVSIIRSSKQLSIICQEDKVFLPKLIIANKTKSLKGRVNPIIPFLRSKIRI